MNSIILSIADEIKKKFEHEGTGHDWFHIDRVRNVALNIQEIEGGNRNIIELAALLHDISDHKFNGGNFDKGSIEAYHLLSKHHVLEEDKIHICTIVKNVSFKGSSEEDQMDSLEGGIVQDADRLDAIGAIGIARTFAYGGFVGQPIYDPSIPPKQNQKLSSYVNERTHTINHFYEKLLLLSDRMHTQTGKKIAQERTHFLKSFLAQFYKEWNGK